MNDQENIDNKILTLMFLNKHLPNIQGYDNIYYKENNKKDIKYENNMNNMKPSIYNKNIGNNTNLGGELGAKIVSNFSIYADGEKQNPPKNIPSQFRY